MIINGVSQVPLVTAIGWMGNGVQVRDTEYIRLMDWRCKFPCLGSFRHWGLYVTSKDAGATWNPDNVKEALWLGNSRNN